MSNLISITSITYTHTTNTHAVHTCFLSYTHVSAHASITTLPSSLTHFAHTHAHTHTYPICKDPTLWILPPCPPLLFNPATIYLELSPWSLLTWLFRVSRLFSLLHSNPSSRCSQRNFSKLQGNHGSLTLYLSLLPVGKVHPLISKILLDPSLQPLYQFPWETFHQRAPWYPQIFYWSSRHNLCQ